VNAWPKWRAGSMLWLLAHECRLFFYDMGGDKSGTKARRGMPYLGMGLILLVLIMIHYGAWMAISHLPPLGSEPPAMIVMGAGAALIVVFSLMLSLALNRSVKALFTRGDLDLLLSSPLSSHTIFSVRLAGIVFGVAILFLVLLSPFAHIGLLVGQFRWLGIYPTLISMAIIASSLAMLLTLALVRLLGVRRTLTAAQLLGALTGAGIFLISQLFGNLGEGFRDQVSAQLMPMLQKGAMLGADSWLWIPARALFGSPLALLVFTTLGVACFWLTSRYTHDFFVRGIQQAGGGSSPSTASMARANKNKAAALGKRFRSGATRNIVFKEWRLIARDPQLISQVALQLLYMLPLFFVIFRGNAILPGVASGMTFLAASLAGSLIWIIISAEDAPDLLRASPVPARTVRHAKLAAAMLPVCALIVPALGYVLWRDPVLALFMLLTVTAAMGSSSLIQLWHAKPGTRDKFNKRGQAQFITGLLETASSFSWSATIFVSLKYGVWGWLPLVLALLVLGLAWLLRIDR
jgi:ABC-2 type transport system permease protein